MTRYLFALLIVSVVGVSNAQTPSNLTAVNAPVGYQPAVKLKWNGGRGQWMYRIYRSTNDSLHFRSNMITPDTVFTDFSVRADTTYFYYVRASLRNDTTQGPRSNTAMVLVTVPPRIRGTISGTIIDDSMSAPIRNVLLTFFRIGASPIGGSNSGGILGGVRTDSLGRYSALVDTGRYILRANAEMCGPGPHPLPSTAVRYRSEYYNNCYEPACATIIVVPQNQTFTANMGLARLTPPSYNVVSGVVTDVANQPLRNAQVAVVRTVQEMNYLASLGFVPGTGEEAMDFEGVGHARGVLWNGRTDSLGRYRARVLSNNSYIAIASKSGYLPEYWDNKSAIAEADIIALRNRDTSGINFSLAVQPVPNNSISGVVRDSLGTLVPSRISLIPARNAPAARLRYAHTDSLGAFTITAVEAGKYFVLAHPFSSYAPAFYKANAFGVIRIQDADTVTVAGNVAGITVGVKRVHNTGLARLSGRIRTATNAGIAGARVTAMNALGDVIGIGLTDGLGSFALDAVESGVVTIVADRSDYRTSELNVVVGPTVYNMNNLNITMTPNGPTVVYDGSIVPETFALMQNYPNPFNPSTTISFELRVASRVSLQVFNVLGQQVASLVKNELGQGKFDVAWNGTDDAGRSVASGIYFYRLQASALTAGTEFLSIKKMLLLK